MHRLEVLNLINHLSDSIHEANQGHVTWTKSTMIILVVATDTFQDCMEPWNKALSLPTVYKSILANSVIVIHVISFLYNICD